MKTANSHGASSKPKPAATVPCAFCNGTGKDPFDLLSKLSMCSVCKGRKRLEVERPTVACAYCRGTGRQRHTRLACSGCGGAGVISLAGPTTRCTQCNGTGREPDADLQCSHCKGAGLIGKTVAHEERDRVASGNRKDS